MLNVFIAAVTMSVNIDVCESTSSSDEVITDQSTFPESEMIIL